MIQTEYKPLSSQKDSRLEVGVLKQIGNPNLRAVALSAVMERELIEKHPDYRIQGTYSEAYSGE